MAPPPWAYQIEYFDPPPHQEFVCSICQCVFCEPVEGPCRHVYCSACIKRWIGNHRNCPICRVQMRDDLLQPVNRIIKNVINGLNMRCKNSESGCEKQLTHEATEGHALLCPFELEECSNGCGRSLLRKEMTDHKAKDCPCRRIECSQCGLTVLESMTGHNCIRMLRQILEEQQKTITELKSEVAKLQERLDAMNQRTGNLFTDTSSSENLTDNDDDDDNNNNDSYILNSSFSSISSEEFNYEQPPFRNVDSTRPPFSNNNNNSSSNNNNNNSSTYSNMSANMSQLYPSYTHSTPIPSYSEDERASGGVFAIGGLPEPLEDSSIVVLETHPSTSRSNPDDGTRRSTKRPLNESFAPSEISAVEALQKMAKSNAQGREANGVGCSSWSTSSGSTTSTSYSSPPVNLSRRSGPRSDNPSNSQTSLEMGSIVSLLSQRTLDYLNGPDSDSEWVPPAEVEITISSSSSTCSDDSPELEERTVEWSSHNSPERSSPLAPIYSPVSGYDEVSSRSMSPASSDGRQSPQSNNNCHTDSDSSYEVQVPVRAFDLLQRYSQEDTDTDSDWTP